MNQPLITSLTNPLIKKMRALRQRKARTETRLFIVEGLHHVGEALEAGWKIDLVLYSPDILTSDFGRDLISRVASGGAARQRHAACAQCHWHDASGAACFHSSDGIIG